MVDRHCGTITSMSSHSAAPGQISVQADAVLGIARFAYEQYRECPWLNDGCVAQL